MKLSEADFQANLIELATITGWRVHHDRPAPTSDGARWVTHVQGDAGFPDLVLARRGRVVFAELKTDKGVVTAEQSAWLQTLDNVGSYQSVVWRPSDIDAIAKLLGPDL